MLYEVEIDVSIEILVCVCLTVNPAHVWHAEGALLASSVGQRRGTGGSPLIIKCFIKVV